jgi:hypothetical protein
MGSVDPQAVHSLVAAAGLGPVRAVTPMAGGANNRVFRVEAPSGTFLLKSYFRHPDDPRDRLATEFAFSRFAWDNGVRCIPQPIAYDPEAGLGLFEYVFGRGLQGTMAGEAAVDQAIAFYQTLNRVKRQPAAAALPTASESCFSLDDHLAMVDRRVTRLQSIPVGGVVDVAAAGYIEADLVPAWRQIHAAATTAAHMAGLRTDQPLSLADRCLSPSDFGFHNAILGNDGRLRFIDFEYAGWDDPSKLICDFFCQPAVPAPPAAFTRFAQAVAAECADPVAHVARSTLLLPVYRVKWVCIMLNEFLPVGGSRRLFSGTAAEQETRKTGQLAKARVALASALSLSGSTRKVA